MDHFTVVTDHKPLKGVFSKELPDIENARLCRYRGCLTCYNFDLSWREGKTNHIADALSRAPVFPPDETDNDSFVNVQPKTKLYNHLGFPFSDFRIKLFVDPKPVEL